MENESTLALIGLGDPTVERSREVARQVTQALKTVAVQREYKRITEAAADQLADRDYRQSQFADTAAMLLATIVPGFDRDTWRCSDGTLLDAPQCQPDECCGWCADCQECHGDGRDEVCNMDHCHECDHTCDR